MDIPRMITILPPFFAVKIYCGRKKKEGRKVLQFPKNRNSLSFSHGLSYFRSAEEGGQCHFRPLPRPPRPQWQIIADYRNNREEIEGGRPGNGK